ncbi:MAG: hypothetical protein WCZ87_00815 [Thiohalobacteraceae bacterium]
MRLFKQDHLVVMIAAPIVWAVHFLVSYILVSLACGFGWTRADRFGLGPAEWGVVVATAVALTLIGYAAAVNVAKYRRARAVSEGSGASGESGTSVSGFIALTAVLLCVLSAVAVVWAAMPVLLLPTCVQ